LYEAIFSSSRGYNDSEEVFCWGVCSVGGLTLLGEIASYNLRTVPL